MSIWKNPFKKRAEPEPPATPPEFRYELVAVPGARAVETCLKLREEGKGVFTPVIAGDADNLGMIKDVLEAEAFEPSDLVARGMGLDPASFFKQRKEAEADYYEQVEEGVWPAKVGPGQELTAHLNIRTGKPMKIVYVAKVPTPRSFEVPAYLRLGGWNECPAPEEHVALLRFWHDKYGAQIISATDDVIECTVSRPPSTREQAMELAREQFLYCADIVYQGVQTVSNLGAGLLNSKYWYFWWD